MDLPYLLSDKDRVSSKIKAIITESKYKLKRIFAKRVRIFRTVHVPLWLLVFIIGALLFLQRDYAYSSQEISTKNQPRPDYSSRRFQDKFDLKYSKVDKRKVSKRWIGSTIDEPFQIGCVEPEMSKNKKKANAALVMLVRNKELKGVIKSMSTLERHFNQWFNYPWVFLNDEEFSDKFKRTVKKYTKSKVEFGVIEKDIWDFPLTKDREPEGDGDADEGKNKSSKFFNYFEFYEYVERQGDRGIMYGSMDSYHKMCRFYSGGFYRHPLVAKREWYWRVEPDVHFYCDLTYDPFLEMERAGKKYGFTVLIKELSDTVPNLFRYTKSFIKEHNVRVKNGWNLFVQPVNTFNYKGLDDQSFKERVKNLEEPDDLILAIEDQVQIDYLVKQSKNREITSDKELSGKILKKLAEYTTKSKIPTVPDDVFDEERYNFCHFWSNFEIAKVDVWNNELYQSYFDYLEQSGGFYKERWGDAPVHSLGAAMFLSMSEIHYFRDIGYKHSTIAHCPSNSFDNQIGYTPSENYFKFGDTNRIRKEDHTWLNTDTPKMNGVGCRCKCPRKQAEIEDTGGSCISNWILATKDAEANRFNNAKGKYERKLNVKKLKDLIAADYAIYVKGGRDKPNTKYISSALEAYKAIKKNEEDEQIRYSADEFDQQLLKETESFVMRKKLNYEELNALNDVVVS